MPKRSGINKAPALVVAAVVAGGSLTACGGADEEQVPYCVNADDEIVDDDLCDQDNNGSSGMIFWYMSGPYRSGLEPGTKLDRDMGTRINPSDKTARAKAGLPKTGKVTTGKSGTYFKSGGFGSFKGGGSGS